MTKRVKYTAIWKAPIKIVKESKLSFFLHYVSRLNFIIPSFTILLNLDFPPPQQFYYFPSFSTSSFILYIFPSTNTLTSYRPYIDPTSTLDSTFFNTTSWIEKLYRTTTTFLLFSLHHHHHHISFVFPPPPPPHFFCFPATTITTSTLLFFTPPPPPPPPCFYCFPSPTFLLFPLHHHHHHISIVSLHHHHHQHITIFPSTTTFLLFTSSSSSSTSTSSTSSSSFLLFSLEKAKGAKLKPRRPHSNSNETEEEVVEVDEEGKQ